MSANPQDVNAILEEMAQAQPQTPPAATPQQVLTEAVQQPPQPPQPAAPAKAEFDAKKFGQLLNDNADLRQAVDTLTAEVQSLRTQAVQPPQPAQPPQPVPQPDDGGWSAWGKHQASVVNEVDEATWLANPKAAVEEVLSRVLTRGGRELTEHGRRIAQQEAAQVGMAQQLDNEFTKFHPDLMTNDRRQGAVRYAISQVIGDPRFQVLMRDRESRPRAYAVVAKLARRELGLPDDGEIVSLTPEVPQRKSVFAETSGGRPGGAQPTTSAGSDKAMEDVITYVAARK